MTRHVLCRTTLEEWNNWFLTLYNVDIRKLLISTARILLLLEAVSEVFLRTMKRYGIETEDRYIREGIYHAPDVSAKITHELLSLEDRPTCIVYPDDFSCIGGINVIRSKGLSIPNDISVAGYDGQRIAHVIEPKITTYRQNTEQIGKSRSSKVGRAD